ncbi:heavy-metal-associated domain-containing protein [Nocardia acidivorans]|uniref:heavy-metal-associated domain-containing protein n=1 Tax=Nocardia acidivorans TaxID=404580 RepID=UPI000835BF1C|nr:heavy metal-associated domain-containing protein [Nocardia acidivorans]
MSNSIEISDYTVTGVTCAGCAGKVQAAVGKLSGVDAVQIELATGRMSVIGAGSGDGALIKSTVENLGYGVAEG